MLVAAGKKVFGAAGYEAWLGVTRALLVEVVARCGLRFDSRFVPAALEPARDVVMLWWALDGEVSVEGADRPLAFAASPVLYGMREADYIGADGRRATRLATRGDAFLAIDVRCRAELAGPAFRLGRLTPSAAALAAARAFVGETRAAGSVVPAHRALLEALVAEQLLVPAALVAVEAPTSTMERALWTVIARGFRRLDTGLSLKAFDAVGLSARQLDRVMGTAFDALLVPARSWRGILRQSRLALAALLLSHRDLTVKQIAREVGYGNPEALANAFQRVGLPSPTQIQADFRATP